MEVTNLLPVERLEQLIFITLNCFPLQEHCRGGIEALMSGLHLGSGSDPPVPDAYLRARSFPPLKAPNQLNFRAQKTNGPLKFRGRWVLEASKR